jgi:hypothetical protein
VSFFVLNSRAYEDTPTGRDKPVIKTFEKLNAQGLEAYPYA